MNGIVGKSVAKGGIIATCIPLAKWINVWWYTMVNGQWFIVSYDSANKQKHHKSHRWHMSQILCCPEAWITDSIRHRVFSKH